MVTTAELPVHWNEHTVEQLEVRKAGYQLLVDFLGEAPTLEVIMSWRNHPELIRLSQISEGARIVHETLCKMTGEDMYRLFARLRDEYARLFNRGGELPVTPCETMYRANEQMLPKSYAQEVCKEYEQFSLHFKKLRGETDDHIAIELEFMITLIEKMLNTVMTEERFSRYMNGQRRFVKEHLQCWAARFAADLKQYTTHPLYGAIAMMLQEFVAREARWALEGDAA
ncbi:TorD/DmsD family molecular chaperone [Paenibacillus arenosi]|uniref:Molecular chaperone TorD family protein n=1 Tax=Paenibacillus arenosi TaxID=2774142 RepID=A0ABR9AWA1_9BACL|nr:molecular chaperone TorD family protein [Paenibacillus arenosi]MBD8498161.1 molecular chaperone TorD family protein [Paenibacillus arenosi]